MTIDINQLRSLVRQTEERLEDRIEQQRPQAVMERDLTVPATERTRTYYSIDKQGQRVPVGSAVRRDYDGNRVSYAVMEDTQGREFRIGRMSQVWETLDHADVLLPLLDNGFNQVRLLNHRSGGTSVLALLTNPEITLNDVIGWDQGLFDRRDSGLQFGLRVETSLRYGEATHIQPGFWRVICENGLMSEILGLGEQTISHRDFAARQPSILTMVNQLVDEIERARGDVLQLPTLQPRVPTSALEWGINTLHQYNEQGLDAFEGLPSFAREPLTFLVSRMPTWGASSLTRVLEAARLDDSVGVLDIVNAITNTAASPLQPSGIQSRMGGDPSWTIYDRVNPLSKALRDVIDIGAFRAGATWSKN